MSEQVKSNISMFNLNRNLFHIHSINFTINDLKIMLTSENVLKINKSKFYCFDFEKNFLS